MKRHVKSLEEVRISNAFIVVVVFDFSENNLLNVRKSILHLH